MFNSFSCIYLHLYHPQSILDKTPVSIESFNSFLHENYIEFFADIEDISDALDYMSDSDCLLATAWKVR